MKNVARELLKVARELVAKGYTEDVGAAIAKDGRKIKGWNPEWEYPGYVVFSHPKYKRQVAASPWWEGKGEIDIQVQAEDGDFIDGFTIRFPASGDLETDVDRYFGLINRAWSKVMKIVDTYDHRELMKEIYPKFEKWVKGEQRSGGEMWHYDEDFHDDIDGFVESILPDVVPAKVKDKVVARLFDDNKDDYVERGSRYEEE